MTTLTPDHCWKNIKLVEMKRGNITGLSSNCFKKEPLLDDPFSRSLLVCAFFSMFSLINVNSDLRIKCEITWKLLQLSIYSISLGFPPFLSHSSEDFALSKYPWVMSHAGDSGIIRTPRSSMTGNPVQKYER